MTELGPLIASGRAADVYEYGAGLVLRRYRTPTFGLYEAAAMQYVASHGYPVPRVLHPDNVIVSPSGPVVIDWSNVGRGDPHAEVADLWLSLHVPRRPATHSRKRWSVSAASSSRARCSVTSTAAR